MLTRKFKKSPTCWLVERNGTTMLKIILLALGLVISLDAFSAAPAKPGPEFYRALTMKIRPDGDYRIYMPDGRHQNIKYHFKFAAPVYTVPMLNDLAWNPPSKDVLRSFWDKILLDDESFLEVGGERVPLTCISLDGQDNRYSGQNSPVLPQIIMRIFLVANDFDCKGPLRPGWPATGGRRESWDTYLRYEVRDPTIMLPQDVKLRYRWNEFDAVLIDQGGQ